jgi:hypothetical protein
MSLWCKYHFSGKNNMTPFLHFFFQATGNMLRLQNQQGIISETKTIVLMKFSNTFGEMSLLTIDLKIIELAKSFLFIIFPIVY